MPLWRMTTMIEGKKLMKSVELAALFLKHHAAKERQKSRRVFYLKRGDKEKAKEIRKLVALSSLMELNNMPPLNSHQAYQLWMITQGKVISLGVFKPAEKHPI